MTTVMLACRPDAPMESFAEDLAVALGLERERHESSYLGEYFLLYANSQILTVMENVDPLFGAGDPPEQRFRYPDFAEYPVLIEIEGPTDWVNLARETLLKRCRCALIEGT